MSRLLEKLSSFVGAALPPRIAGGLRWLRLLAQTLTLLLLTEVPWLWLSARLESAGLTLPSDLRPWIGWPAAAAMLALALWEAAYDANNPRPAMQASASPTSQSEQSIILIWLGLSAMMGVLASIFLGLSLGACVLIAVVIAVPGLIPGLRDRFFDVMFGKRETHSDKPPDRG